MTPDTDPQHAVPPAMESLLQQAIAHHRAGRLLEAGQLYQAILQDDPAHPEANHNLGVIAVQAGQPAAGLPYFMAALDADPTRGQYWLDYIDALFQAGQPDDARAVLALARQQGLQGEEVDALALRLEPGAKEDATSGAAQAPADAAPDRRAHGDTPSRQEMDALVARFGEGRYAEVACLAQGMTERFPRHDFGWKILGVALKLAGRSVDALAPMQKAAELSPGDVEAHYNLGVTLQELGRLDEAAASYRHALQLDPDYADAGLNLGVTLNGMGRLDEAEAILRGVLLKKPDYAEAHGNLGAILQAQGRLDEAEACFRRALLARPDNAMAHCNLGGTLHRLGRLDEAEACFRRALEISPDHAEAHASLGVTLQEMGRLDEADTHFRMALQISPDDARAHENRGNLLGHMERPDEAEACYRRALQITPGEARIHVSLGKLLLRQGRLGEAERSFRRALEISPDDLDASNNLGHALQDLGLLDQAEACYRNVLRARPDNAGALSNLGKTLLSLGRMDEAEASFRQAVLAKPGHAPLHSNLLYYLALSATADVEAVFSEHVRFGEQFERDLCAQGPTHTPSRDPERRLQIGFVSPDFYNHAVASFIEPVLAHLSGSPRLSLHAYYNNLVDDAVTQRLRRYFSGWNPVAGLSDEALAEKIRADGIDILIDLAGHTAGNRLPAFALKPAPLQASWIGYPGTTGLRAVDYYFADRFLLPPGRFDGQFTEKIVRLPANAPFQPCADAPPVNELPALRAGRLTFGSFNRPNKLSRDVIALWSKLLRALPDSRMLLGGMPEAGHYGALIAWFAEEGIAPERLAFHPRSGMQDYLALHHQVDICLDTFPYNGGTTTHHALWMGVPTLTLSGTRMAGRAGTAILSRVGLEEFAVERPEDFVARGLYWAENLSALAELRAGLREHLVRSPLRQPAYLAAGLEAALRTMWRRWCAGLPAETFEVPLHGPEEAAGDART